MYTYAVFDEWRSITVLPTVVGKSKVRFVLVLQCVMFGENLPGKAYSKSVKVIQYPFQGERNAGTWKSVRIELYRYDLLHNRFIGLIQNYMVYIRAYYMYEVNQCPFVINRKYYRNKRVIIVSTCDADNGVKHI